MIQRILLVDIEYDRQMAGQITEYEAAGNTHHPLGLMYLAAMVRKQFPDVQVRILHTATCQNAEESLKTALKEFSPQLVGLRALSLFQKPFKHLAQVVRETRPEAFLIGGGPYPSGSYREIVDNVVDLVVRGEGEMTFVELIEWLNRHGTYPDHLDGTVVKVNGELIINPARGEIENIDVLPKPAYNLIQLSDYKGIYNLANQSTATCVFIESSRGCTYKCYYCHAALSKTVRRRSPELVLDELQDHYNRGVRDFVFVDDIFNVPKKIAKEILRGIIQRLPGVSLNFSNGLRADRLDDEILDLFEEAGTVQMSLAVETATPRLQKLIVKYLDIPKAAEMIHKASQRFIVRTLFMVGFPTESLEEAWSTVNMAKEFSYVAEPAMSIVRVYPGTPLFDALNPTPVEARKIEDQTADSLLTRLMDSPSFYGDFFPREKVPLTGKNIQEIRWEWMRNIYHNRERIRNSHGVLERHLNHEQILTFYRNLYQKPDFDDKTLERFLGYARTESSAAETPA
ncbi:MAG: hypothetical protein COV67_10270 [Nitrospinae bacterium CG11_big_fil_rev_8_21_14_0_20_56_8]|nr:MAG: hypothetical protein COV67_10270 [Nitrospinae bacterium CG11_big_fil_rev_8_21_14_0_20_56_8]